ncbi:MAG: DUF465 domain-containing protein [Bauldia sp.]
MSAGLRLAELERRHADLEKALEDARSHPGVDALELANLKRQKLVVKDEIERLKATLH